MNKRLLSLLLAACLLAPSLAACSDNGTSGDDETQNTPPSTPGVTSGEDESVQGEQDSASGISDDLPDVSYNGYEYMIFNTNAESNDWYTTVFVTFEEDSAETIPSAVFQRNLLVEDRFDVKIAESYQENDAVKQSIIAGSQDYDIALLKGDAAISFAQSGYLMDLNLLNHLDFTKSYWDNKAAEQLTIANKLYLGVGDFMTTHIDETIVTFFNKGLVDDLHVDNPYDLVDNMQWTYAKMGEMGITAGEDADGNGVYNDQDKYALMSWSGVLYPYLIYGSGEQYMTKVEGDAPEITFFNDRFVLAYETILNMCHNNGDGFLYDANLKSNTMGLSNNHRVQEIMFPNNQVLFWVECVSWSKALRDMDTDFGIIPAPMLDETQGQYYNYVNGNFYAPAVPTSVPDNDFDRTCVILEALNSMSTDTVLDAYYNITLQSKYSRDVESGRMLDIIFTNRLYDVSIVFVLADISTGIYDMAAQNKNDLSSYYSKNRKAMNKTINTAYEKISALDY